MLIRDLINIPERVHKGDFVLKLTDGVRAPKETLGSYVVTEQLGRCFEQALGIIKGALESGQSKAAYLHGSFGSGKSHFMAVLHLLLGHEPGVRAISELAPPLAKHEGWLRRRKFLLVPYHMLGARSMEAAILGGYAKHVRELHPEAPAPGVYARDAIFENARSLRTKMGDRAFFDALNAGGETADGWGTLTAGWDAASFEKAQELAPSSEESVRLVGDLVRHLLSSHERLASTSEHSTVSLDDGLPIVARHAKALGYDAVLLFLDELILWLASNVADRKFVSAEGQKLAKLVEAGGAKRELPIVSFIARQRDLRELVGEHVPGAEKLSLSDVLGWNDGRFEVIKLEDRNLPAIAKRRVLAPKDSGAARKIDEAFESATPKRQDALDVLITSTSDRATFREVYPFSPALIQALVALSSMLQRERTALRVMLQMLVERRDDLKLGDLLPAGDLYDVIADGDEPLTEEMRHHFEAARNLYERKILPLLEGQYGMPWAEVSRRRGDARAQAFMTDARLVKTLMLSALVPDVECFRNLTPMKLATLNHGTIETPLPGGEGRVVLKKLQDLAARVGEIKIGSETANPTLSVQLAGVDVERVLERAQNIDNHGNRLRLTRSLLFEALGVKDENQLFMEYEFKWRGTTRKVPIVFGNVRDEGSLPDDSFKGPDDGFKLVIDYPFDESGHYPSDDVSRVGRYQAANPPTRTLVWLPGFFHRDVQRDLGTLVKIEHILTGERFGSFVSDLAPADRAAARTILDNQRNQLRQRVVNALEVVYGAAAQDRSNLMDPSYGDLEHLHSLDPSFQPRLPVGATLEKCMQHLLDQMWSFCFPAHPLWGVEVKAPLLKKALEVFVKAARQPDGRLHLGDKGERKLMSDVAEPLELGKQHEGPFLVGNYWRDHFDRRSAADGGPMTVKKMRAWMDEPKARGLQDGATDLVVLAYAAQTQRATWVAGRPSKLDLGQLTDEVELREQTLPKDEAWAVYGKLVAGAFGMTVSPFVDAQNVSVAASEARSQADRLRPQVRALTDELKRDHAGIVLGDDAARAQVAREALCLLDAIIAAKPDAQVEAVINLKLENHAQAIGRCVKSAESVLAYLHGGGWEFFEPVFGLAGPFAGEAKALESEARRLLESDEWSLGEQDGLEGGMKRVRVKAAELLGRALAKPPTPVVDPLPPVKKILPPAKGWKVIREKSEENLDTKTFSARVEEIKTEMGKGKKTRVSLTWRVEGQD